MTVSKATLDRRLAMIAVTLISHQINAAAPDESEPSIDSAKDVYVRGYIVGFCDAMLLAQGIDRTTNLHEFRAVVLNELFGPDSGRELAERALSEIGDEGSTWAQTRGAQDFLDWRKDVLSGDPRPGPPTGLLAHLA